MVFLLEEYYLYENGLEIHTTFKENEEIERKFYRRESGVGKREKIQEVNSLTKILENVFDYHSDRIIMNLFIETSLCFFLEEKSNEYFFFVLKISIFFSMLSNV